jgi:DNA topoisomerase-3
VCDRVRVIYVQGITCPLDGFELLLYSIPNGKSIAVCPACYNAPSIAGQQASAGCNLCPHLTCPQSMASLGIWPCAKVCACV